MLSVIYSNSLLVRFIEVPKKHNRDELLRLIQPIKVNDGSIKLWMMFVFRRGLVLDHMILITSNQTNLLVSELAYARFIVILSFA